jgi:hypothetical protein
MFSFAGARFVGLVWYTTLFRCPIRLTGDRGGQAMLAFLEIMRSPNKRFTVGQCVMWLRYAECQDLEENGALEPNMFLFSRFSAPPCTLNCFP